MKPSAIILVGLACCFLIGCASEDDTESTQNQSKQSSEPASTVDADPATGTSSNDLEDQSSSNESPQPSSANGENDVDLKILDWEQAQAAIAQHRGKIVVVDLWSTSCLPCLQEFPNLVALHRKYGNDRVACISVSCDYEGIQSRPAESYRESVLAFLTKQQATFENILLNVASDEFWKAIDLASIPAVYVYDSDGKVAKRFDNDFGEYSGEGFTYEAHIIPFVERLLDEHPQNGR